MLRACRGYYSFWLHSNPFAEKPLLDLHRNGSCLKAPTIKQNCGNGTVPNSALTCPAQDTAPQLPWWGRWGSFPTGTGAGSWIPAVPWPSCPVQGGCAGVWPWDRAATLAEPLEPAQMLWLSPACDAEHGLGSCLVGVRATLTPGCQNGKARDNPGWKEKLYSLSSLFIYSRSVSLPFSCALYPYSYSPLFFMYFWLCVGGAFIFLCTIHMILFPHMDVGEDSWLQDGDKAGRSRISHQGCLYCQLHLKWDWILLCFGGAQIILWIKSCTPDSPLNALFWFKSASGWFKKFKRTSLGVYLPLKFCYWNICSIGLWNYLGWKGH